MDPHWTSYVGMATGIVGLLVAIFAHRRVNKLQKLNVKHEASVEHDRAKRASADLLSIIDQARRSRRALLSARGLSRSGAWQKFESQSDADQQEVEKMCDRLAGIYPETFDAMNHEALFDQLTTIRQVMNQVSTLTEKYASEITQDERGREELQAETRAMIDRMSRNDPHGF